MRRVRCVTNNPGWGLESDDVEVLEGTARDVFLRARDLVHGGWRFLAHPLYGSYHPARSPYRTLLLEKPQSSGTPPLDLESFAMLEEALAAFRNAKGEANDGTGPEKTGNGGDLRRQNEAAIRHDYAVLDRALMEDSVRRYLRSARNGRRKNEKGDPS